MCRFLRVSQVSLLHIAAVAPLRYQAFATEITKKQTNLKINLEGHD